MNFVFEQMNKYLKKFEIGHSILVKRYLPKIKKIFVEYVNCYFKLISKKFCLYSYNSLDEHVVYEDTECVRRIPIKGLRRGTHGGVLKNFAAQSLSFQLK